MYGIFSMSESDLSLVEEERLKKLFKLSPFPKEKHL
jgi:hypothetical protein